MKVDYVVINNMDILEDGFKSGILETKDYTKDFGKHLPTLLSHITISFIVSDISILEAFYLKYFCNGEFIDLETFISDDNFDKNKFPASTRAVRSLFTLNNTIENDDDISIKPGIMYFPVKTVNKRVIASFTGQNILSVIGDLTRTNSIFTMLYIDMKSSQNKTKKELLEDLLIKKFVEEFYKFMSYKITYIDLLTDSLLSFNYLEPISTTNKLVSLSHVNSMYGSIPFINIDNETYKNSIAEISLNKINLKNSNMYYSSLNKKTTEVYFTCSTSFYAFLEAALILPLENILESTDNKILYLSHSVIIPKEMKKYETRLSTIMKKITAEKEDMKAEKTIDKYNLILLNTKIQYTLKFNLNNIGDILLPWEEKIKNNAYGNSKNFISEELLELIDEIRKYSIAIYSTIDK